MTTASGLLHPKYRPDIDGLRAIAVLSVVGFHAFPGRVPGGFVGVDIFFVISGFLISTIIIESLEHGQFSFIEFYARRIRRIFPALLIVLAATLGFGWIALLTGEFQQLGEHVLAGAAFVSNLVLWRESGYFDIDAEAKPLLHLWSLGIEEQYYIIWPLLLWIAAKARLKLLWVAVVIGILSFALNIRYVVLDPVAAFYSPFTRLWELLAGSILAWITIHYPARLVRISGTFRHASSLSGLILIASALLLIDRHSAFPGWLALLPVAGAVLLIAAGPAAWINRALLARPVMVWFGLISFPLYLWHWPLLSFGYILENASPSKTYRVLVVIAAILLAWGTYRLLELRVRRSRKNQWLTALLVALMIAIGAAGYWVYRADGVPSRRVVLESKGPEFSFDMESNPASPCPGAAASALPAGICTQYAPATPKKTIVLWGDSSTGAWLPVFRDIGKRHDYAIVNIMHLSCPPILDARKTRFDVPEAARYCKDGQTQRKVIDYLRALAPDMIVMIGAWNSYSAYSNREFLTDRDSTLADAASTARVISEGFPRTMKTLASIAPTMVFESWPVMPSSPKARVVSILGIDSRSTSVERLDFEADSRSAQEAINSVENSRLYPFDPSVLICDSRRCQSTVDALPYYADRYHVTPLGAMQLRPRLELAIKNMLGD